MADDMELVREFAARRSDAAFETLVARHLNLVYSVALRQVRDPLMAQEVAQAVFIILARKAKSLGPKTILSGWLFRTAQYASADALKIQRRRQHREQEAYMESILNCGGDALSQPTNEEAWAQIVPLLDAAMLRLGEKDRNAIVLRYFENKNLREVGAALGASEDSARVRINRALDKLRKFFTKRGVMLSATLIATVVSANSVQAAPVGLAATISAAAVKSSAVAASTLTLVKGALKIMAWTKAKTAVIVAVATILAMSTATVVVKETFFPPIRDDYFQPNYRHFQNLPRDLFTLRPTHFTTPANGLDYSAETSSPSGEHVTLFMGRNRSFEQLINKAYGGSQPYTVFPANLPGGNFDYLCTILDNHAGGHLQAAIKRKFGYVANWQQRDTEVFLLKVQTPNAAGLKPASRSGNSEAWRDSESRLEFRNRSLASLANQLQNAVNIPVLDQTGRADALDFDLNCAQTDLVDRNWDSIHQALGQLGLELVPTNMPIEMLVVKKAN